MSGEEGPKWRSQARRVRPVPCRSISVFLLVLALPSCRGAQHVAKIVTLPAYQCPDCNVLLISIDTLRADHLHVYGYGRDTSPNIDDFARQAVLFEQNINTGGGTLPVHASMFTSLPPTVHGVWADNGKVLASERVTLAEQLHAAGYQTRGYTGGGFVQAKFGLGQGFDYFYDEGGDFKLELPLLNEWLVPHRGGKFFLFLHTYDVHSGYDKLPYDHGKPFNDRFTAGLDNLFDGCRNGVCASELLGAVNRDVESGKRAAGDVFTPPQIEYMKGLYDGGIAYVDAQLGFLFEELKALGLWDKTIIVLTADHGEEFAEHGMFLHDQNYDEIARVPLLIRFPYGAYGGRRISELVSTLEIMPTILDVLGIPASPEVEGRSVMPLIAGGREGRPWVYMAGALEKLRTPAWSLFAAGTGPALLYDLRRDPGETVDVLAAHPETAAALYAHYLAERRQDLRAWRGLLMKGPGALVHLSQSDRARLRALGYAN
jgi:arylsulfatase A-like enzyme